jgi:hypothetical protein
VAKVILSIFGAVLGILFGGYAGGGFDIFFTVIMPHGGWDHVSEEKFTRFTTGLTIGTMVGGITGVVLGALWDRHARAKDHR